MAVQDKIVREIVIDAPPQRVWELVSEPGWWIGDGDRSGQRRWKEGDLDVIEDPRYGRFPLRTVASDPPRYVAFRWVPGIPEDGAPPSPTTLVEFWVREQDGGTIVQVVESGFAAVPNPEEAIEGNTKGWIFQLDVLKSNAEREAA
jgi:uncharacterized protein YndB with AHSA1/START domain